MELMGENHFKVSAFRKAANTLELDPRSLQEMDNVLSLKGIGKGTGAVIQDLMEKGESDLLQELEEVVPAGLVPMLKIPGLGGKRIAKLHDALGIDSIEALKEACEAERVSTLPGFGKKTEANFLAAIETLKTRSDRFPIWKVEESVALIEGVLQQLEDVTRFSVAGSYRRTEEDSSDVDFIIVTENPSAVREQLMTKLPVLETIAAGDAKLSITLDVEDPIDADFRFVADAQFATAIHHFTGSKDHNVRMRQLAKSKGWKISEYGVEDEHGEIHTFEDETGFFNHFNLPFIPPALRQDGRELDRVDEIDGLIDVTDIRADLHMHTTWSDGGYSIREMVEAARAKKYSHIVITDHSHYLKVANGLTPERLRAQIEEIRTLNEAYTDIEIFCGTEMDILPDATLDFDDGLLAELDFVIAAIHSSFTQSEEQIMERIHTAMKNPHIDMIAHPTGRIIGKRDGYRVNMTQIIEWAKQYGKILELNANPYRLDLKKDHLIEAQEAGVKIAINTDAHAIDQLDFMVIGTKYAKKAWIKKELVVNTWSTEKFIEEIVKK